MWTCALSAVNACVYIYVYICSTTLGSRLWLSLSGTIRLQRASGWGVVFHFLPTTAGVSRLKETLEGLSRRRKYVRDFWAIFYKCIFTKNSKKRNSSY